LKHRERVIAALNHEEADRCPISFTPEFADRLCEDIGNSLSKTHNPHGGGNTYELERYLDEDLLLTSVGWANSYYQSDKAYTDEWDVALHNLVHLEDDPIKKQGLLKKTEALFQKVETLKPGCAAYNMACCLALQGDPDKCREWLNISEQHGKLVTKEDAMEDKDLESVRGEEWFKNLKWKT